MSEIDIWNLETEVWGGDYFTAPNADPFYPHWEISITLPQGTTGRYVEVYLHDTNFLSLAEVQVFDTGVPEPATFGLIGLGALALGVLRRR